MSSVSAPSLFLDHFSRVLSASEGWRIFGPSWTRPWIRYAFSPLIDRFSKKHISRFAAFKTRSRTADLYTFANLFTDYSLGILRRAVAEVDQILDLGANVGAFSFLATSLCEEEQRTLPIIALEPNPGNASFLRQQPFADRLRVCEAAVGPWNGTANLIGGHNSVTDRVDFSSQSNGHQVPVRSFAELCDQPSLVKMDIEGGEHEILAYGLPQNVRHLFLEWHPKEEGELITPAEMVPGDWREISRDPYGSTTWYFRR